MREIPELGTEPMGAEAAIGWHLREIAYHDNNESMADACDMPGSADYHRQRRLKHTDRLAVLEAEFPATAREARRQFEVEDQNMAGTDQGKDAT